MCNNKQEAESGLTSARRLAVMKRGGRLDPFSDALLDEGGGSLVSESLPHARMDEAVDQTKAKKGG